MSVDREHGQQQEEEHTLRNALLLKMLNVTWAVEETRLFFGSRQTQIEDTNTKQYIYIVIYFYIHIPEMFI